MTTIKPAIEIGARATIAHRTGELFRSSGALREGHFELKSGRHGDIPPPGRKRRDGRSMEDSERARHVPGSHGIASRRDAALAFDC